MNSTKTDFAPITVAAVAQALKAGSIVRLVFEEEDNRLTGKPLLAIVIGIDFDFPNDDAQYRIERMGRQETFVALAVLPKREDRVLLKSDQLLISFLMEDGTHEHWSLTELLNDGMIEATDQNLWDIINTARG